jgi:hypothetical protein
VCASVPSVHASTPSGNWRSTGSRCRRSNRTVPRSDAYGMSLPNLHPCAAHTPRKPRRTQSEIRSRACNTTGRSSRAPRRKSESRQTDKRGRYAEERQRERVKIMDREKGGDDRPHSLHTPINTPRRGGATSSRRRPPRGSSGPWAPRTSSRARARTGPRPCAGTARRRGPGRRRASSRPCS